MWIELSESESVWCVKRGPHANPPQIIDADLPGRRRRGNQAKSLQLSGKQTACIDFCLGFAAATVDGAEDSAECHWGVKWLTAAFHRNVLHKEHDAGALPVALVFSFSFLVFVD